MNRRVCINGEGALASPASAEYISRALDAVVRLGDIPVLIPSATDEDTRETTITRLLATSDLLVTIGDVAASQTASFERTTASALGLRSLTFCCGCTNDTDLDMTAPIRSATHLEYELFVALRNLRRPAVIRPTVELTMSRRGHIVRPVPQAANGFERLGGRQSPDSFRLVGRGSWQSPPGFRVTASRSCSDTFWIAELRGHNPDVEIACTIEHSAAWTPPLCQHQPVPYAPFGRFGSVSGFACQRPSLSFGRALRGNQANLDTVSITWQVFRSADAVDENRDDVEWVDLEIYTERVLASRQPPLEQTDEVMR
jgi:hypothetical protein